MTSLWLLKVAGTIALFGFTLAVRLDQHHSALLYPDGYQYLLMARGISEHLQPTTVMGPGGDVFVPSADAAVKPLFPLLVAAAHALGLSWLDAAEIVTAVASAATVTVVCLLVVRLGGSWVAGAAAALVLLASSTLAYWSGFAGPDPLAQALGLGATLAFVERRPALGGSLLGLAAAARPEFALLGLAGAVVFARAPERRPLVKRGAITFGLTLALVYGALRPAIALPDVELLVLVPVLLAVLAVAMRVLPGRLGTGAAVLGILGVLALGTATAPGVRELWRHDWPLLGLGLAGFALVILRSRQRGLGLHVGLAGILLGAVYWVKNPELERYFAIVLPVTAAILVGIGVAELSRSRRSFLAPALAAIAVTATAVLVTMSSASYEQDVFSRTAERLSPVLSRSGPLVTAAPDAYSFWLPTQTVRAMRPGVRGQVLLDPAQRAYAPQLGARGRVIARVSSDFAFSRPDGEIDPGDAVLVEGRVTEARADAAAAAPAP